MKTLSDSHNVKQYFNSCADSYRQRSHRLPWSLLRAREQQAIELQLPDLSGQRVLDACAGTGFYSELMIGKGAVECVAVDISNKMSMQNSMEKVKTWTGNVIDFKDKKLFDLVLCAGGLEFLPEPSVFFEKALEWTKQAGVLTLLYPPKSACGLAYQKFHCLNGLNIRLFTKNQVDGWAKKAGWKSISHEKVHPYAMVSSYGK